MLEKLPIQRLGDPSKFSFREENLDLEKGGTINQYNLSNSEGSSQVDVYVDKNTGEKFHKIKTGHNTENQKLAALIFKGIINVSDVVKVNGEFYSHIQNFDALESSKEEAVDETIADRFLLNMVLTDHDHYNYPFSEQALDLAEIMSAKTEIVHHNLILDVKNNKLNFFDFGMAFVNFDQNKVPDIASLVDEFKMKFKHNRQLFPPEINKNNIFSIIQKKVKLLLDQFAEHSFGRFQKIIKRSGVEIEESKQQIIFDSIRIRLLALDQAIKEIK